jgi:hypothetical protein
LFWPGVTVNDFEYRGNLDHDGILEFICAGYISD